MIGCPFSDSLGIQGVCHCERSEVENARRVQSPLMFTEIAYPVEAQVGAKNATPMTFYKFPRMSIEPKQFISM